MCRKNTNKDTQAYRLLNEYLLSFRQTNNDIYTIDKYALCCCFQSN